MEEGTDLELKELRKGDVARLLRAISRDEKYFRVRTRPRAVNPFSRVTSWEMAKRSLAQKLDEARPGLVALLGSPERRAKANALEILLGDKLKHRRKLKKRILELADDHSGMVRRAAVRFLGGIVDEEVEVFLTERLRVLAVKKGKDLSLIDEYLKGLNGVPKNEERVAVTLLHFFDHVRNNLSLGRALSVSKRFGKSEKYG